MSNNTNEDGLNAANAPAEGSAGTDADVGAGGPHGSPISVGEGAEASGSISWRACDRCYDNKRHVQKTSFKKC